MTITNPNLSKILPIKSGKTKKAHLLSSGHLLAPFENVARNILKGKVTFINRSPGSAFIWDPSKEDHYLPSPHRNYNQIGIANANKNKPYFVKTIRNLVGKKTNRASIIIGSGPSLHRADYISQIISAKFQGDIICIDSALGYCLKRGLIPHYVVITDPHPSRIVAWFGDRRLNKRVKDSYLSRRDPNNDPTVWNKELIALVNKHGKKIKAIISTGVDRSVTKRCLEAGMKLYWWNPIYDDYEIPNSLTRQIFASNQIPCMSTGGHSGAAAWVFASAVLKHSDVALIAIDLSYAPGTALSSTQHFQSLIRIFKNDVAKAFVNIYNPYINETWFADPIFLWFRNIFLTMVKETKSKTYYCSRGGILFKKPIHFIPFSKFLSRFSIPTSTKI